MRIKEIIKAKGLTINELADKLDVSRQALSKQIQGRMLVETADKIASALEVPTWQLFVDPEDVYCEVAPREPDFIALIKQGGELYSASSIDEAIGILEKLKK